MNTMHSIFFIILLTSLLLITGCPAGGRQVVVCTNLDKSYTEPVFAAFEQAAKIKVECIRVRAEEVVERLIAERKKPGVDLLWCDDYILPIALKEQGILVPYATEYAKNIPAAFRDEEYHWTGFGGKAGIFLVNTTLLTPDEYPESFISLLDEKYAETGMGMAFPGEGFPLIHAAAIYGLLGREQGKALFMNLKSRGVEIFENNRIVRDKIAAGELAFGYTDTASAMEILNEKTELKMIYPGQESGNMGTLVVTNTLSLIKDGPHQENAIKLFLFLLKGDIEEWLIDFGCFQFSLLNSQGFSDEIRALKTRPADIYRHLEPVKQDMGDIFNG